MRNGNASRRPPPVESTDARTLLRREPFPAGGSSCEGAFRGKRVLVTGAAGSIGSELCRTLGEMDLETLILLDNDESRLNDLYTDLRQGADVTVLPVLASILDQRKMERLFAKCCPDMVFHLAALKHVELLESHPDEALRVNVLGTRVVCEAAYGHGAAQLLAASTDKAVAPTSIMGATKFIAEEWMGAFCHFSGWRLQVVRLCNVLGSRGSLVPRVLHQIERGGPVTVTHPQMVRHFITLEEAVRSLIGLAASQESGGKFVVAPPEGTRILDLVRAIIAVWGVVTEREVSIRFTGAVPGEKLQENLMEDLEIPLATQWPHVLRVASSATLDVQAISSILAGLSDSHSAGDNVLLKAKIWETVEALRETAAASL